MSGDPNWSSCVFFPDFTGSNGNTTFTDQSDNGFTITTFGSAQTQSNRLRLDGTLDYLTIADDDATDLGAEPFTIASIINMDAIGSLETIVSKYWFTNNNRSWWFRVNANGKLSIIWSSDGSSTTELEGTTVMTAVDNEVMVDRDASNVLRLYVNGNFEAKVTNAVTYKNTPSGVVIGMTSSSPYFELDGDMDKLKIWKGVAVVGSDSGYTPSSNGLFEVGPFVPEGSPAPRGLLSGPGRVGVH